MANKPLLFFSLLAFSSITQGQQAMDVPGVSSTLAAYRRALLRDIRYDLAFSVPVDRQAPVQGKETVIVTLATRRSGNPLLLDFKAPATAFHALWVNGKRRGIATRNEHLLIPAAWLHSGADTIGIEFM